MKAMRQQLAEYIQMELDGTLSDEQFAELTGLLKSTAQARQYYARTVATIAVLRDVSPLGAGRSGVAGGRDVDNRFGDEFWQVLSQYEKDAQPLQMPEPEERLIITDVRSRKAMLRHADRKIPASIWVALGSLAAFLVMVAYVTLSPRAARPVATLTDMCGARWLAATPQAGARLGTDDAAMVLLGGYARLQFDHGAEVTIEGPAEFKVAAEDRLDVIKGKVYAIVPQEAIGFSVYTKNTKIVDLGTEFGVDVDSWGETCLHVIRGSTQLIAGEKSGKKTSFEVRKGNARKVSAQSEVTDIPYEPQMFVRSFNSKNNCIWKGQTRIDLADIVGGGTGLGSSKACVGIDPASGEQVHELFFSNRGAEQYSYHRVVGLPFIDGVFIPMGDAAGQVVSSEGHVFEDCPRTSGDYWMEISNRPLSTPIGTVNGKHVDIHHVRINRIEYGTPENPAIMMHPNVGITFDLGEIRATLPADVRIRRFVSVGAISETITTDVANAVLWVLLDGQVCGQMRLSHASLLQGQFEVPVNETARFLTLAVTEGENDLNEDWTFFANPALVLELVEE